ncbi:helix-turn-helix domain-containing protein [Parabacteroides sp. AM08-6]|uniref:helix-turn-helix domain-containing protein n=1 Tax=Parabacteroides sp. AM08-6 TaxID=2292053 RepID=UPI000F006FE0|nr:helix-turn-helix transcriptional regulator [Parabacteroides sp. AM08-6]RHJ80652.1 XRE family transcriptional regulator [Parabacteroides sp. AM08-6]
MFNGQKISELIEERKIAKKDVYDHIGVTKSQLDNYIKGKNIPGSEKLESLADFFGCSIEIFFNREIDLKDNIHIGHQVNGHDNNVSGDISLSECKKELELTQKLLKEKDERIKEKDEMITLLKQQLNK